MRRVAQRADYEAEMAKDPDEVVGVTVRITRRRRLQLGVLADAQKAKKAAGWGTNALISNEIDKLVRRHRDLLPPELRD